MFFVLFCFLEKTTHYFLIMLKHCFYIKGTHHANFSLKHLREPMRFLNIEPLNRACCHIKYLKLKELVKKKKKGRNGRVTLTPSRWHSFPGTDGTIPMWRALSSCQRAGATLTPEKGPGGELRRQACEPAPASLQLLLLWSSQLLLVLLFLGEKVWKLPALGTSLGLGSIVKPPSTWKSPVKCVRVSLVNLFLSSSFPHPSPAP